MDSYEYMLSFCILTYNHEKYIRECLDHVFSQQVNFKFEILIGDDCSTDNTTDIVDEYGDKVTLYRNERNVGLCHNMYSLIQRAKGKYVGVFSGDDFLYDDLALQKQIDFLEKNPDYFSASGRIITYIQNENRYVERKTKTGDYTISDFFRSGGVPTTIGIMRNIFRKDREYNQFLCEGARNNEEIKWWLYTLDLGKRYIFEECMTVYRYRSNPGESNYCSNMEYISIFKDYYKDLTLMDRYYGKKYRMWPLKLTIMNDYCMAVSNKKNGFFDFLKVLQGKDRFCFLFYKLYLKLNHYQKPEKWNDDQYFIR